MQPRLSSSLLVNALIRQAESNGGFGAVLARGDATAGSILLVLTERGQRARALERVLQANGEYQWQRIDNQAIENTVEINEMVERRRRFDPDLWVVELDIPSPERFAAEMNASN